MIKLYFFSDAISKSCKLTLLDGWEQAERSLEERLDRRWERAPRRRPTRARRRWTPPRWRRGCPCTFGTSSCDRDWEDEIFKSITEPVDQKEGKERGVEEVESKQNGGIPQCGIAVPTNITYIDAMIRGHSQSCREMKLECLKLKSKLKA